MKILGGGIGRSQNWTILEGISKHSRAFSEGQDKNWNIFRGLLAFNYFWG